MNEEEKESFERIKKDPTYREISLLRIIEKQQKENELLRTALNSKDRQIDLMAEYISDLDIDEDICKKMIKEKQCNHFTYEPDCTECVKQYFKNKAEEDK